MKFIIFHGSYGTPDDNWYPQLKEKLESLGQKVIIPQLPKEDWKSITKLGSKVTPKKQNLKNWLSTFEKEVLPQIKKTDKLCFIGHSISCIFILHVVDKLQLKLDSAIFVSPFMDSLHHKKYWQFDHVNRTFYKTDFDFAKLRKLIPISYVLYSSNDPYVNLNHSTLFAKALDSSIIFVKKAGHMNSEVNMNAFPLVVELCKTRLDLTIYQKYIAYRKEKEPVLDYLKQKHKNLIDLSVHLAPEEIFDEGRFKFRNLKYGGMCTFMSSLKNWDANNYYSVEGRKAARMTDFTRVILVEAMSDLKRPLLINQIKLDIGAGIKIYLCKFDDVKKDLPEPDFGIWDDEYVCIVNYTQGKEESEIILDSRNPKIKEAKKWRDLVMNKAVRIYNIQKDISRFISKNSRY
ncbi:alpha/beta hydrolase [Candidatus Gottesmanbacteria bacterium]|nr:alpha/beta hydrolase [Candidatus Gottesmanbacteria bacterium]